MLPYIFLHSTGAMMCVGGCFFSFVLCPWNPFFLPAYTLIHIISEVCVYPITKSSNFDVIPIRIWKYTDRSLQHECPIWCTFNVENKSKKQKRLLHYYDVTAATKNGTVSLFKEAYIFTVEMEKFFRFFDFRFVVMNISRICWIKIKSIEMQTFYLKKVLWKSAYIQFPSIWFLKLIWKYTLQNEILNTF